VDQNTVIVFGICGIVAIELAALYFQVNGALLASAVGGIASLVGYAFGQKSAKK